MNYEKHIKNKVCQSWFSSKTDPDWQLNNYINNNLQNEQKKPLFNEICKDLFQVNPYDYYIKKTLPKSKKKLRPHIDEKIINYLEQNLVTGKPLIGIEVGSYIEASALLLGNFVKSYKGSLICVDTWCGDTNMWLLDNFSLIMDKKDGNPKLFEHFMNNIIENNLSDTVIPLRVSSIVGARLLKILNYEIDFCYLDSAHEMGETFFELSLYYDLLKDNGILFGDDYFNFPAVKHDVDLFCNVYECSIKFVDDTTWIIQKK